VKLDKEDERGMTIGNQLYHATITAIGRISVLLPLHFATLPLTPMLSEN